MTLEVEIYGRNIEVTDRIQDYVNKKVSKLDRYLSGIEEARVDLAYVKSAAQRWRSSSCPIDGAWKRIYFTLGGASG